MENHSSFLVALDQYFVCVRTDSSSPQAKSTIAQTETTLYRYTLPGMGLAAPQSRRLTRQERLEARLFADALSVEAFLAQAVTALDAGLAAQSVSDTVKYANHSHLRKLLTWMEQQPWGVEAATRSPQLGRCAQNMRRGYGKMTVRTPLTDRPRLPAYGLRVADIPPQLQQEIEVFKRYRTAKQYPGRNSEPVKASTLNSDLEYVLQLFGFALRKQGLLLNDELSFSKLVPVIDCYALPESEREAVMRKASLTLDHFICDYCEFMEHERLAKSPSARSNPLKTLLAITKFVYLPISRHDDFRDIPLIDVIRKRLRALDKEGRKAAPVVKQELKWLDLPDVFVKVVEPLRLECEPAAVSGSPRSLTAIAASLQLYVIWGNLCYMPPRRQSTLRQMRMTMSCPYPRPAEAMDTELYQPLPEGQERDCAFVYLYRNAEGDWIRDMPPKSYKTGDTYGYQELVIPNVEFPDGRTFYDYLEQFLYGYYINDQGQMRGCGSGFDPVTFTGELFPGRMAFTPEHDSLFCQTQPGKNMGIPLLRGNFSRLFSNAAHRFTGKRLTPHLLRDVYATHFLDQEYSDAVIESLAYDMGHSQKTLRKMYDKRRPQQKRRPVQQAIKKMLHGLLGTRNDTEEVSTPWETIRELLPVLSPEERQQLRSLLS